MQEDIYSQIAAKIGKTAKETRARHSQMSCKVYTVKVQDSATNFTTSK